MQIDFVHHGGVDMGVDQSRHQGLAGAVDDVGIGADVDLRVHLDDALAADEDRHAVARLFRNAVDHPCVAQQRFLCHELFSAEL